MKLSIFIGELNHIYALWRNRSNLWRIWPILFNNWTFYSVYVTKSKNNIIGKYNQIVGLNWQEYKELN